MPILVEKNVFQKLLGYFLKAKANGKEKEFISKIQHKDPKVGAAFSKFDDIIVDRYKSVSQFMKDSGVDTEELDDLMKKYYY